MSERQNRQDPLQDKPSDGPSLFQRVSASDILTFPSMLHCDVIYPLKSTSARDGGWRAILIKTRLYKTPVHRAPCAEIACPHHHPLLFDCMCISPGQSVLPGSGALPQALANEPSLSADDYDLSRSTTCSPALEFWETLTKFQPPSPRAMENNLQRFKFFFSFFFIPRVAEKLSSKVRDGHFICSAAASDHQSAPLSWRQPTESLPLTSQVQCA